MTTTPTGRDFYPCERRYKWLEVGTINGVMYRGSDEKQALIERFFLGSPQDQPAQPPATGEDPAVELQRSFFEIPGFMQPPQSGGS